MFDASLTTDIPEQNDPEPGTSDHQPPLTPPPPLDAIEITDIPGPSNISKINEEDSLDCSRISVESIILIPKVSTSSKRSKRKRQGRIVLTSTPNLEEVKAKEESLVLERRAKRNQAKVKLWDDEGEQETQDPFAGIEDNEEDAACIYCNSLYSESKSGELWLRCQKCEKWSHAECAGVSSRTKLFTCEVCD